MLRTWLSAGARGSLLECRCWPITSHLVDFGAEVIKVESPAGDYVRQMTWPIIEGTSLLHLHVNRGKQSLVLDLKVPEAIAVFEELVRDADVVIEAMRPGFLDKRGLGYERLQGAQPEDRDVHDLRVRRHRSLPRPAEPRHRLRRVVGHAPARHRRRRASPHPRPGQHRHHRRARVRRASASSPRSCAREKTGEGACMEIAQSDARAYFDWYRIETWKGYDDYPDDDVTGNPSDNYERRPPGLGGMWEGVRYQYYEASDGHILFMASEQAFWKNFCEGIDRMDLFEKWPGKTIADHARGNKELQASCATSSAPARSPGVDRRSPTSTTRRSRPRTPPQTVRARPAVPGPVPVADVRPGRGRHAAVPAARRG